VTETYETTPGRGFIIPSDASLSRIAPQLKNSVGETLQMRQRELRLANIALSLFITINETNQYDSALTIKTGEPSRREIVNLSGVCVLLSAEPMARRAIDFSMAHHMRLACNTGAK
jgi:hypothetical protein